VTTGPAGPGDGADAPAAGIGELDAEMRRGRSSYGQDAMIVCDQLVRIYTGDGIEVQALQGLDLLVAKGELTGVVGASGSGKSTLMNILAGLDTPTAGAARVAGHDLAALGSRERLAYRRSVVGFIWQQSWRNLLPYLTCRQNVSVPMRLSRVGRRERIRRTEDLLEVLGVAHCAERTPDRMSGGEQQRTAIARALVHDPRVIIADEPTGNLDPLISWEILQLLLRINDMGVTVLMATHNAEFVTALRRRVVALEDGRVVRDEVGGAYHRTD
jgi:ABC-type lipoprotein export system ATPase subunit